MASTDSFKTKRSFSISGPENSDVEIFSDKTTPWTSSYVPLGSPDNDVLKPGSIYLRTDGRMYTNTEGQYGDTDYGSGIKNLAIYGADNKALNGSAATTANYWTALAYKGAWGEYETGEIQLSRHPNNASDTEYTESYLTVDTVQLTIKEKTADQFTATKLSKPSPTIDAHGNVTTYGRHDVGDVLNYIHENVVWRTGDVVQHIDGAKRFTVIPRSGEGIYGVNGSSTNEHGFLATDFDYHVTIGAEYAKVLKADPDNKGWRPGPDPNLFLADDVGTELLQQSDSTGNVQEFAVDTTMNGGVPLDRTLVVSGNAWFRNTILVDGDLVVKGTQTTIYSEQMNIGDNLVTLNGDVLETSSPTEDAGVEINRGSGGSSDAGIDKSEFFARVTWHELKGLNRKHRTNEYTALNAEMPTINPDNVDKRIDYDHEYDGYWSLDLASPNTYGRRSHEILTVDSGLGKLIDVQNNVSRAAQGMYEHNPDQDDVALFWNPFATEEVTVKDPADATGTTWITETRAYPQWEAKSVSDVVDGVWNEITPDPTQPDLAVKVGPMSAETAIVAGPAIADKFYVSYLVEIVSDNNQGMTYRIDGARINRGGGAYEVDWTTYAVMGDQDLRFQTKVQPNVTGNDADGNPVYGGDTYVLYLTNDHATATYTVRAWQYSLD